MIFVLDYNSYAPIVIGIVEDRVDLPNDMVGYRMELEAEGECERRKEFEESERSQ